MSTVNSKGINILIDSYNDENGKLANIVGNEDGTSHNDNISKVGDGIINCFLLEKFLVIEKDNLKLLEPQDTISCKHCKQILSLRN